MRGRLSLEVDDSGELAAISRWRLFGLSGKGIPHSFGGSSPCECSFKAIGHPQGVSSSTLDARSAVGTSDQGTMAVEAVSVLLTPHQQSRPRVCGRLQCSLAIVTA